MANVPIKIQQFLSRKLSAKKVSKNIVGQVGEEAVVKFIKQLGWKVLHRNWRPAGRYHGLELDIIAQKDETLIFIEVKTRTYVREIKKNDKVKNICASELSQQADVDTCLRPLGKKIHVNSQEERKELDNNSTHKKIIPAYVAFTQKKQQHILQATRHYLSATEKWEYPCRFDLFCVQEDSTGNFWIEHYEHVIEIGQTLDSRNSHWEPW